jgi:hypothetical protein
MPPGLFWSAIRFDQIVRKKCGGKLVPVELRYGGSGAGLRGPGRCELGRRHAGIRS